MSVKQRLIDFLKYKKIGQKKFAQIVGVSDGYVNAIRVSIQPDTLHKIAMCYPELNTGWLMTGNGEMLNPNATQELQIDLGCEIKSAQEKFNQSISVLAEPTCVPLLPISAQGGTLNDFIVSVKGSDCEKVISPIKGADFAMSVAGESMYPEYPAGSQILIKKINEKAFIEWGKVYVLDTCNGTVIKIITKAQTEGKLLCTSINPDQQRYAPFEISKTDIYGIYRVLLCMSVK